MGAKYFCDKCGKEVRKFEKICIETQWEENISIIDKREAFICNDCKKEFFIKIKEIKEIFGFRII